MSRRPQGDPNRRRQAIINGTTAWTLESVLAPPARSSSTQVRQPGASALETGIQQLATTTGQSVETIRDAIPLFRDPRVRTSAVPTNHASLITAMSLGISRQTSTDLSAKQYYIAAISEDPEHRRVTVRVRPDAERALSTAGSDVQRAQAGMEYRFVLTLSRDRRQIAKVDTVVHGPES